MPAWVRTWLRLMVAVSGATSTSRMREFAAERFSRIAWMLLLPTCGRFLPAPHFDRAVGADRIFCRLRHRDAVGRAALGDSVAADLRLHALADGEASRVVRCGVDAVPAGELVEALHEGVLVLL